MTTMTGEYEGVVYDLTICAVNGDMYDLYSQNKTTLFNFLKTYDHEGSTVYLTRFEGETETEIKYDDIYAELQPPPVEVLNPPQSFRN